jgi:hypothetical protein
MGIEPSPMDFGWDERMALFENSRLNEQIIGRANLKRF